MNDRITVPAHHHVRVLEEQVTGQALEIARLRALIAYLVEEPREEPIMEPEAGGLT